MLFRSPVLSGLEAFSPEMKRGLLGSLNAAADELERSLVGIGFEAGSEAELVQKVEQFISQQLPAALDQIFGESLRAVSQASQLRASIEAQINALEEAIATPAEIFEKRLGQIAELEAQLSGAGIAELTTLAPQLQGLVAQAFQLAPTMGVLGQDEVLLSHTQTELINVLRNLQSTLASLPSFQGLMHPITFARSTLASIHQGETLLPAGSSTVTISPGAIVINADHGMDAGSIAEAVIDRIERVSSRFGKTRIQTRGHR